MMTVAQQEAGQLLASLAQRARRRQTRSHEIADRLMSLIWNPDRGQFTGPVQLGEVDRIPSVGLDPITGLARDQRRSDHDASVPVAGELWERGGWVWGARYYGLAGSGAAIATAL